MALNIKNDETHQLSRQLADLTGESLTTAVTVAVRERLDRVRGSRRSVEQRSALILELGRQIAERRSRQDSDAERFSVALAASEATSMSVATWVETAVVVDARVPATPRGSISATASPMRWPATPESHCCSRETTSSTPM